MNDDGTPALGAARWWNRSASTTSARPRQSRNGMRPWPEQEEADVAAFRHSSERIEIPKRAPRAQREALLEEYLNQLAGNGHEPIVELFSMDRNNAARRRLARASNPRIARRDQSMR